jgi:hypothetical protein
MSLDPPAFDRPSASMPKAPPLDWPEPPELEPELTPVPEGWNGRQVALIGLVCLLAGALIGVLFLDRDDDSGNANEEALVPTETTAPPVVIEPPATLPEDLGDGPPATSPGSFGSRERPVPIGLGYLFAEWSLEGWSVDSESERTVRTYDPANRPPADGNRFVLASTELTYIGIDSGNPANLELYAEDADGNAYDEGCGSLPVPLLAPLEMEQGDSLTGQVCFEVPAASVPGLRLVIEEQPGSPVYFAIG